MSLTQEMAIMIGPKTGKLYRVHNPLGIILGFHNSAECISLEHNEIIMVVSSKMVPVCTGNQAFSFSIVKGDKLYESLLAFPVWFNHNFELIQ